MSALTTREFEILKSLVGLALENRGSALSDLANQHREELYVVFAKLVEAMAESAPEPQRSGESWPAAGRLISG